MQNRPEKTQIEDCWWLEERAPASHAEDCQDNGEMMTDEERRMRFGNNRYHMPKYVAKAKRKAAKKSRQRNRQK